MKKQTKGRVVVLSVNYTASVSVEVPEGLEPGTDAFDEWCATMADELDQSDAVWCGTEVTDEDSGDTLYECY